MSSDVWGNAVRGALALALGSPSTHIDDWPLVFHVCRAERLLGIAWLRSGASIRATAPASLVTEWRRAAVQMDERARAQLDSLVAVNLCLVAQGVTAIALKGPPLSTRLYGEPGTRHSVDIDLLIPDDARAIARAALERAGWTNWFGRPPWDESFCRHGNCGTDYLEVHSRLPGEALSHCQAIRLEREPFRAPAGTIDVAGGPALPVYLASNMAKHGVLPLSAVIDFHALWELLDASDREAAAEIARACRLLGCLRWAAEQTILAAAAAAGERAALQRLGVRAGGREFGHSYLRLIKLADRPLDAARIAGAWMWPRSSRGSWAGLKAVWRRRSLKSLADARRFRQSYART